jgi:enterobactin synthetase component D
VITTIPRILPAWVSQVSLSIDETAKTAASSPMPPMWQGASPERQRKYRAGRYCAQLALEQLGLPKCILHVTESGAPAWPAGTVGSITHTPGFVSAAAAVRKRCPGIGLDVEPIGSLDKAHALAVRAATSSEVFAVMDAAKTDYATAVTVIVSAKHSLYKCLHPQIGGRAFSYLDASIDDAQLPAGRFRARLKVSISPAWPGGTMVTGQVEMAGDCIYTGIALTC